MNDEVRAPSALIIERSVSLWQQQQAQLAEDAELANDENAISTAFAVDAGEVHPDELLRRLVIAIVFAGMRSGQLKTLAQELDERRLRYDARVESMRRTLLDLMVTLGYNNFGDNCLRKVIVTKGHESVVITDENKLPDEYVTEIVRVIRQPDKAAIGADLRQGVVIEGAELHNTGPLLQLRRV